MSQGINKRMVAAGAIGNVLEWYDFAVYGYFATSIGRVFFPKEDPIAQLLFAFGVFAIGYLMRPLGGMVIGNIGDRIGRKQALSVSVAAMAIPTFIVGILPGYDAIGLAAPILLTICRMLQGLSVGGEYTTSIVFMVENAPSNKRGMAGALAGSGAVLGILLGSATGTTLAALMSPENLNLWGWRIPFLLGLVIGIVGLLLRRNIEVKNEVTADQKQPIIETIESYRPLLARLAGLSLFNAVTFYLIFVYLVSWFQLADKMRQEISLEINTISMIIVIPIMIIAGAISDRIGRKPLLIGTVIAAILLAYPLFNGMHHPSEVLVQLCQLGFAVIIGIYIGSSPAFMVETAPTHIRSTSIALGYNLTLGIVGGLTPLTATWLVHQTHSAVAPAFMIIVAALLSLSTILFMKETYKQNL
jgi:MHS family proline/betaine transporter-like MFS transporter